MPRAARVVAAGVPHHLTQRGNNRQDVFLVDADRRAYLDQLRQDCRTCGVRLLGYCLMTNHVHLIAVPERVESLGRALRRAHAAYSQGFNRRYRRSGHLWQNRFFSCPLGPDHLVAALAYVDLNPVRAGMVGEADQYPWSSARAHLAGAADDLVDRALWREVRGAERWAEALERPPEDRLTAGLRRATYSGTPFGGEGFVSGLERRFGRRLRLEKPGPKPAVKAANAGM